MTEQEYFEKENNNSLDDENTEYYESIDDLEDNNEENFNTDEFYDDDLQDDEDIATEKLTPTRLNIQYKIKALPPIKSIKDSSESPDMYKSRLGIIKSINETNVKGVFRDKDNLNVFSRIVNNKFWYNMTYPEEYETSFDMLF